MLTVNALTTLNAAVQERASTARAHHSSASTCSTSSAAMGPGLTSWRQALRDETGAQTAEYGVLTLAAVGFAGLLAVVLTSGDVQAMLSSLVSQALNRG
ncbi:MAG: DUF4244 domain-containing protein [Micrococcus sp.]|nr:DUF4244 domain-containing protein [Micrococcus sp.]